MTLEILREFGFTVAMAVTFLGVLVWIIKIMLTHFLGSIKEANTERKEMTNKFTGVIENHIKHNTEALKDLSFGFKDMKTDFGTKCNGVMNELRRLER